MSIDHTHLHRLVTEMEQGVNATTRYSWLDLAHEILRTQQELNSMKSAWQLMLNDPERTPIEQECAAHVIDHIDAILGKTNE